MGRRGGNETKKKVVSVFLLLLLFVYSMMFMLIGLVLLFLLLLWVPLLILLILLLLWLFLVVQLIQHTQYHFRKLGSVHHHHHHHNAAPTNAINTKPTQQTSLTHIQTHYSRYIRFITPFPHIKVSPSNTSLSHNALRRAAILLQSVWCRLL